jgi:hypothetical protein
MFLRFRLIALSSKIKNMPIGLCWNLNSGDLIDINNAQNLAIHRQEQAFADKLQAQGSQIEKDMTTQSA